MLGLFIEGPEDIFDTRDAILTSSLLPLPGLRRLGQISRPDVIGPTTLGEFVIEERDFERVQHDTARIGAMLYHNPSILRYPRPPGAQCKASPVGDADNVAASVTQFTMGGETSLVVVADGGFDAEKIKKKGRPYVNFAPELDFPSRATPINPTHAFMVAWDCTLVAPRATLVNAVMPSESGTKADFAWELMDHLITLDKRGVLKDFTGLVLCCAWESGDVDTDYRLPPLVRLHDNARHPLHVMVEDLVGRGFDIVIGAGNCGCGTDPQPIHGINAYRDCLTVGAVDLLNAPDPLSSHGETGSEKPDISAYSNFTNGALGKDKADSGTSAATGIASGIVAAIRSMKGLDRKSLAPGRNFRDFLKGTVDKVVLNGGQQTRLKAHDERVGWGILH